MAQQNNQPNNSVQVKSPYNFVPAPTEDQVFKPNWASQVSHDIPFEDGQSGELDITITAETPIFIRNGHAKPAEGENPTSEFSHILDTNGKKQYFIPATSIKGMLRNVLEIMSFSRMKQVDDDRHAIRQIMKTGVMDEGYELANKKAEINCGYLVKNDNNYFIYSCGQPYKIRFTDLDRKFKNQFSLNFGSAVSSDFNKRTGAYKYETIIKENELEFDFEKHLLDENDKQKSWVSQFQKLPYVKFSENYDNESFKGRIVCVGQASAYNVSTGRKGEYVFKGSRAAVIMDTKLELKVSKDVIETFLFINKHNKKESEELKDWTYWKTKLSLGVPVFFRKDKNNEVIDLGMTFMYKQPVANSISQLSPYKPGLDLAECIFGTTQKGFETKGRVFISNCLAKGQIVEMPTQKNVLSSPKSSYTPFYLKQNETQNIVNQLNTYNTDGILRGFKKYPVHNNFKNQVIDLTKPKLISESSPLPKNTVFKGKIRFHNLTKLELGALISSISLHGTDNTFFNIGGLKPFGYGRVKMAMSSTFEAKSLMKVFETRMKVHNHILWDEKMKELITMSKIVQDESSLEYMKLEDFQLVKEKGGYLKKYSTITNPNANFNAYASDDDIQRLKKEIEQIKIDKENIKTEILNNAKASLATDNFEESKGFYNQYKNLVSDFDLETTLIEIDKTSNLKNKFDEIIKLGNIENLEKSKLQFSYTKWSKLIDNEIEKIRLANKAKIAQNQANETLVFKDTNFESIKNVCNPYLKNKQFIFSEIQKKQITDILKESYVLDSKKNKDEWNKNKGDFKKYPWTEVTKWLEEEQSQQLHKQLVG